MSSRRRTPKQTAMHDLLTLHGPLTRIQALRDQARMDHPELPSMLVAHLPESEGTARDCLESLVRRGEATRLSGSPARYCVPHDADRFKAPSTLFGATA